MPLMAATHFQRRGRALLLTGALLVILSPIPIIYAKNSTTPIKDLHPRNNTGICNSVDIRNTMKNFDNLKGCRVIEGFVQILLFDNVNGSAFENISFPELREITDFLLLYRVNGLRSVGQLFPNLAVIRGQDTVFGYSFIIYEMSSLQEIGLYSLTDITAGLIRIDKNPSLCYVLSVDWFNIAHQKEEHFIKNVKAENECPLCPGDDPDDSTDLIKCPITGGRHRCWNRHHCQKICPKHCKNSCTDNSVHPKCCDGKCLGGCREHNTSICHVCRNLTVGYGSGGQCMDNCSEGRFEHLGRRCVTEKECKEFPRPLKLQKKIQHEFPYKIHINNHTHTNSCLLECPTDYMEDYFTHRCEPCIGGCQKECPGTVVDSLQSAKELSGCTHINGSLEIQIRGGKNAVGELEEHLSSIKVIDGYLKIVRSFPLVSLNFLKKLDTIRGNYLESQKYVFVVLDNQNLQDIWNWENRTLKITKGRLFFHFNPKLCLKKIKELEQKTNLGKFTDMEVALNSNGDKIACDVTDLNVTVTTRKSQAVLLEWSQFVLSDHRKLLGYVIYTIAAPTENITLYDGRDACGGDGWRVDDVAASDNTKIMYPLTQLNPYTQYAFYVKTYTIASELSGAQSKIYYVRTLPGKPTQPTELNFAATTINSITITWKKPASANGKLINYIITGRRLPAEIPDRNYCNEPVPDEVEKPKPTPKSETISKKTNSSECSCKDDMKPSAKRKDEKTAANEIKFEDKLYNFVYIKKEQGSNRRKRDIESESFPTSKNETVSNETSLIQNKTVGGKYVSFNFNVSGEDTELVIHNLTHYTSYEIKVTACREQEEAEINDPQEHCSPPAVKTDRTQKKLGVDNVTTITIINVTLDSITMTWNEPPEPNGRILTYKIEYLLNGRKEKVCVTADEYIKKKQYVLLDLKPGNYTLRVAPVSLAFTGEFSKEIYVIVQEKSSDSNTFIIVLCCLCVLCILVGLAWYWRRKYFKSDNHLITRVNPEYISALCNYVPDEWEVDRNKITKLKELGQGSFGMVFEGVARDLKSSKEVKEIKCAIKTINEHATSRERIEFLNEASVMKAFDTAHVVKLLGVVSKDSPLKEILVVMELMGNGDLKSYLRSHRPEPESYGKDLTNLIQPPTLKRILQMAIEIADGMAYLAAKKFVHRDLAARNCMVAEDLTVKIGDFGMARDIYETDYYRKGTKGLLPVRWMAPESLKDGVFSSSSDVWSYGVVLWEMATLAYQPYQGLTNDQVLRYIIDGGIMERPENCPDKLYDLMMYCWRHKSSDRPSFINLCTLLLEDANEGFKKISFYHSASEVEAVATAISRHSHSQGASQDDPSTPLRRTQIENFCLSDDDSEPESDLHTEFTTFPSMAKGVTSNGYVSAKPSNGSTT